ncbi:MAG: hypothetical protein WDO74_31770 [Pseudomonadota bacterium]
MPRIARRSFLQHVAFLPALLVPGVAQATLLRGLNLRDLTAQSRHVLLLTPLDSQCSSVVIGGRRLIVTETSARVDDVIDKAPPSDSTVVVRTLGGVLNGAGLLVHGQAQLSIGAACVAFLTPGSDGSLWVTGMAQGHFPLESAAAKRYLTPSPRLPELVDFEHSGVRALVGQELSEARRLVRAASAR